MRPRRLRRARHRRTADAFAPARIVELDTAADEREPAVTEDGLDTATRTCLAN